LNADRAQRGIEGTTGLLAQPGEQIALEFADSKALSTGVVSVA
jgi:hypothetical protein